VAILSYSTWQNQLGGLPGIVGKPVTLNDTAYIVVGVLP
jgi:hypothetical protein